MISNGASFGDSKNYKGDDSVASDRCLLGGLYNRLLTVADMRAGA